jgi:hypothetical protein
MKITGIIISGLFIFKNAFSQKIDDAKLDSAILNADRIIGTYIYSY